MNRAELQRLAGVRVRDVEALLAYGQWSGAYYLAGYVLELGLKSCVLRHLEMTGIIFKDRKYLEKLSRCWTHDLTQLLDLANLTADFGSACKANPALNDYWSVAKDWKEISRYEEKTESESKGLFKAVTDVPDGVLAWIQTRW